MIKSHKIIRLDTRDLTMIRSNDYKFTEEHGNPLEYGRIRNAEERGYRYQHLYVISDEEVKEGDWYLVEPFGKGTGYIPQSLAKLGIGEENDVIKFEAKKVIATTDPQLMHSGDIVDYKGLPTVPQSFIENYCKNPSEEVFLEYFISSLDNINENTVLRVQENQVFPVELKQQIYSRAELQQYVADAIKEFAEENPLLRGCQTTDLEIDTYLRKKFS